MEIPSLFYCQRLIRSCYLLILSVKLVYFMHTEQDFMWNVKTFSLVNFTNKQCGLRECSNDKNSSSSLLNYTFQQHEHGLVLLTSFGFDSTLAHTHLCREMVCVCFLALSSCHPPVCSLNALSPIPAAV